MTLVVTCNVDSGSFETLTIDPDSSTDLVVKDDSDITSMTFWLKNVVNQVTGCPVISVQLVDLAKNELSEATYLSNNGVGDFEFKVENPYVKDSFTFNPVITFGVVNHEF